MQTTEAESLPTQAYTGYEIGLHVYLNITISIHELPIFLYYHVLNELR